MATEELNIVRWTGSALERVIPLDAGDRPELSRNACTNPSFANDATNWQRVTGTNGVAALTREASAGADGKPGFGRVTWTTGNTGAGGFNCVPAISPVSFAAGDQYTLQGAVRSNRDRTVNFGGYYKLGTAAVTSASQTAFFIPANVWTPVYQVLPPSTGSGDNVYLYSYFTGVTNAGDWMDLDLVMMEKGSTVNPYYDGSSAHAEPDRFEWTGTAGNSQSVRRDARGGPMRVLMQV